MGRILSAGPGQARLFREGLKQRRNIQACRVPENLQVNLVIPMHHEIAHSTVT